MIWAILVRVVPLIALAYWCRDKWPWMLLLGIGMWVSESVQALVPRSETSSIKRALRYLLSTACGALAFMAVFMLLRMRFVPADPGDRYRVAGAWLVAIWAANLMLEWVWPGKKRLEKPRILAPDEIYLRDETRQKIAGGDETDTQEFDVILDSVGPRQLNAIDALQRMFILGLKEAKDLTDAAPRPLQERATRAEAEYIKRKLEEVSASVSVVERDA